MKKLALLILVASSLFACKKETTPPLARIKVVNLEFSIDPYVQPPFTHYIPINDVKIGALAQLKAVGIDTSDIKRITPGRCTIRSLFGGGDLDFIDAISIRLCRTSDNEPNCGQEVFYRDPTPFNIGQELEIGPSAVNDVSEYVLEKDLNVQVKLERLRDVPSGSFDVLLEMEFEAR